MTNFTSYGSHLWCVCRPTNFLIVAIYFLEFDSLGVQISYTLTIFDTQRVPVRHPLLSLLDMLNLTYKRYQNGEAVSLKMNFVAYWVMQRAAKWVCI